MYVRGIKQVRTSGNSYSGVKYDLDGNILIQTKAARKARAEAKKNEKPKATIKCTALTKKQNPCPNLVDDWRGGTLCHVHDPNGKFKQQVKEKSKKIVKSKEPSSNKWRTLISKYENPCVICNAIIYPGEKIMWNIKTRKIKHVTH